MSSAASQIGWQKKDMAFLAAALLVHAALLLLPLKSWQNTAPTVAPRLTVNLQKLPRPPADEPALKPVEEVSLPVEAPAPLPERHSSAHIALEELPIRPDIKSPSPETTEPEAPTIKELREWIVQSELQKSATEPERRLGTAKSYEPPANWKPHAGAPYLAGFENTFNGMTIPEDVEIVDRWLASDGSHNVVVNLPNGDTVCGRAEPWNPMQPLVEHIMMFRSCGGGGKRTFSMPDRFNKGN